MNLFAEFLQVVREAVNTAAATQGVTLPDLSKVTAEPPRDATHGDISTNAAMVLNKVFGMPPKALAETLAALLRMHKTVAAVDIAGPGFINIKLSSEALAARLGAMLVEGPSTWATCRWRGRRCRRFSSSTPTSSRTGSCMRRCVG